MTHPTNHHDSTTDDGTDATGPRAVLFTADRFLAAQVSELHPAVTAAPAAMDARFDGLPESDGVLLLDGDGPTRALYIGVDLDDARIWSRAVGVGATHVVVLPDGRSWLWGHLAAHLGTPTTG